MQIRDQCANSSPCDRQHFKRLPGGWRNAYMNVGNRQESNLERGGARLRILHNQNDAIWKVYGHHNDSIFTDPTGTIPCSVLTKC